MSDEVKTERIFVYDGKEFRDPGSEYSNEQVRDMLAQTFGALRGGEIEVEENRVVLKPAPKHLGLQTVYTFGYSRQKFKRLAQLARDLEALVVDVRFSPRSRNPIWRKNVVQKGLPGRYLHVPQLGNENYNNGGGIQICDMDRGLEYIRPILENTPIILLCVCADYLGCHRTVVAREMEGRWGVEVVHIERESA